MGHRHAQDGELVGLAGQRGAGGHHVTQLRDVRRHLVPTPTLDLAVVFPASKNNGIKLVLRTFSHEIRVKAKRNKTKHNILFLNLFNVIHELKSDEGTPKYCRTITCLFLAFPRKESCTEHTSKSLT